MFRKDLDQPSCDEKENSNRNHKEEFKEEKQELLERHSKAQAFGEKTSSTSHTGDKKY